MTVYKITFNGGYYSSFQKAYNIVARKLKKEPLPKGFSKAIYPDIPINSEKGKKYLCAWTNQNGIYKFFESKYDIEVINVQ